MRNNAYIKPPKMSMNFSENKVEMKKRFQNILDISKKKRGLIIATILIIFVLFVGGMVAIKKGVISTMVSIGETEKYYDYFSENQAFRVLLEQYDIDDSSMSYFAALSLDKPDFENGNSKEEYNVITEKYFGRKIENYNNSAVYEEAGTGKIKPTGWSYDNSVYMILKSLMSYENNRKVAVFYTLNVSDVISIDMFEDREMVTANEEKDRLLKGDFSTYSKYGVKPFLTRIEFEEKIDENGEMYLKYLQVEPLQDEVGEIIPFGELVPRN